ncbi:MAG TPA: DoxX family membrane protein [Solirubrobacteraceae bacterium]|nr:DoxX family membrane protein [Solirubrobacteraceae bacterium]
MKIGRLLLRLTVGGFFFGHGTQKLLGWFGGNGLEATAQGFEQIGLRPGRANAIAAGAAEAGGGALLVAGYATPLAASVLTATMITAIDTVHKQNGPWATKGGYEYNAVLIAAALALAEVGPGSLSLDAALGRERHGPRWALAALATGALGALGARALRGQAPAAPEQATAPQQAADEQQPASADEQQPTSAEQAQPASADEQQPAPVSGE